MPVSRACGRSELSGVGRGALEWHLQDHQQEQPLVALVRPYEIAVMSQFLAYKMAVYQSSA